MNTAILTSTEEDYLKNIYTLSGYSQETVSTNELAEAMQTKPASVTDMMQKLSDKKLITYIKYQGVSMTDIGTKMATQLIRRNRLWKIFLVEKLQLNWDEVEELSDQFEHIQHPLLTNRLDEFLGFPSTDPQGNSIPSEDGKMEIQSKLLLSELRVNQTGIVSSIQDYSPAFLHYLNKIGLYPKTKIKIIDKIEYDGTLEIQIDNKKNVTLSKEISKNILVIILE